MHSSTRHRSTLRGFFGRYVHHPSTAEWVKMSQGLVCHAAIVVPTSHAPRLCTPVNSSFVVRQPPIWLIDFRGRMKLTLPTP